MLILSQILKQRLSKSFGAKGLDFSVFTPERLEFGDYSTNLAFILAKERGTSPFLIAEDLRKEIESRKLLRSYCDRVEVKNGYLNFFLSNKFLSKNLNDVLRKSSDFGSADFLKGKTYLIEHTSPNPNKALHLGHLRNNVTAMAIANMLEFIGSKVIRDCIDNNRGIAIAKLMWGYLKFARKGKRQNTSLSYWFSHQNEWQPPESFKIRPDRFVDELYVRASEDFKNPEPQKRVRQMLIDWEAEDKKTWALWRKVLKYAYAGQQLTLKRLGSKWDKVWHEHEHYKQGKQLVYQGLKKGIFKRGRNGAIVTDLTAYGIPDTVVIKADGTALYITQDLALTRLKKKTFKPDKIFWVIGPEQSLALKQMFAACEQLGIVKYKDCTHIAYGYMSIKGKGRMSSREGTVIYIDDLLDATKAKVKALFKNSDLSKIQVEKSAEKIGVGAVKYGILAVGRLQDIAFDIDQSISLKGNSAPYLQYAFVRTQSVKAKAKGLKRGARGVADANTDELSMLRALVRFPEIVLTAALSYSPNQLCTYLFDLAQQFNTFYETQRVINEGDKGGRVVDRLRLEITVATGVVLRNGLKLLGIDVISKM